MFTCSIKEMLQLDTVVTLQNRIVKHL